MLHDVGHLLHEPGRPPADGERDHEWLGALHVMAKRYLCTVDPDYHARLSPASLHSLMLQGGPLSRMEGLAFERQPYHRAALQLRRWDDEAAIRHGAAPDLEQYRRQLEAAHRRAAAAD